MAKTKTRNKKKNNPNPLHQMQQRARNRATQLVNNAGNQMGFMGGMAWLDTQVIGIQTVISGNTSVMFKEMLADAVQTNLRKVKRDWTLAVAFVSEVDGEVTIEATSTVFKDTTPVFLDKEGTDFLFESSTTMWGDNTFGSIWITVPAIIDDAEGLFEEFEDFLEESGAFDREAIAKVTEARKMKVSLEESISGDTTLRDKAVEISKQLKDKGYPIDVRLINNGRYVYSISNGIDMEWYNVGGIGPYLVSTYLDESVAASNELEIPENFGDVIMEISERVLGWNEVD